MLPYTAALIRKNTFFRNLLNIKTDEKALINLEKMLRSK